MHRRNFIKTGGAGVIAALAGSLGLIPWVQRADAANISLNLNILAGNVTMIDDSQVYLFSYSTSGQVEFPGATIVCQEGDDLTITLTNQLNTTAAFVIGGTAVSQSVAAGASVTFSFAAPPPGSYLYYDDQNNGVNRVMGLHGALIVMPAGVTNQSFPGGPTFVRQYKWILANVDPLWCQAVQSNGDDYVSDPGLNVASFQPRYFLINGQSFARSENSDTELMGLVGEPALVRILNAGMATHSPHFHGNHVEIVSINHQNFAANRKRKDIVSMFPLDTRDVIFPFDNPPDAWPPAVGEQGYPMHCHSEMSQTAAGGMYPHGMHTGIIIGRAPDIESELTQVVEAL